MNTNKAAGLDCAITAEALQGDAMADVIHCFSAEVYSKLTPCTWPVDHQRHCPSTQEHEEGWPEPYDQL